VNLVLEDEIANIDKFCKQLIEGKVKIEWFLFPNYIFDFVG
jgi:hypothetical protein